MLVVPELPEDIRALKERARQFVEAEVYPLEQQIAQRGVDRLGRDRGARAARSREAGFAMLNMPEEVGGPEPLDARPGRARGGGRQVHERARLRRREPRPARALRDGDAPIRSSASSRRRSAASTTGRGRSPSPAQAPTSPLVQATAVRDGDDWLLERREVVRHEPGRPRLLRRARGRRRRAGALLRRARTRPACGSSARARLPARSRTSTTTRRSCSSDCRVPDRNRIPSGRQRGSEGVVHDRAALHRRALLRRRDRAASSSRRRSRRSASSSASRSPSSRASRSSSPTRSPSCSPRACDLSRGARLRPCEPDRKIVHGKVAMAKLYASEMAGRVVDRAAAGLRRTRVPDGEPGRPLLP